MGWRRGDEALAEHVRAAGLSCELRPIRLGAARHLQRAMWATDLVQALAARRAAAGVQVRAVIYSSITAALLQPPRRPHAIRFDTIADLNRPGLGGAWQRRREREVLARADLLLPWSEAAADAAARVARRRPAQIVLPCDVELGTRPASDAPDATAYAANPEKRGLDARFEDWGIAQMEALAAGTPLVTVPTPGPNAALPIARRLAPELVAAESTGPALAQALRRGLAMSDGARAAYRADAQRALEPFSHAALAAVVPERVLPALLGRRAA